jgi:rod shape determining protein RodA
MNRLTIFVNPESDLLGAGYHVWQSRIAIGSGGLTGRGCCWGHRAITHSCPSGIRLYFSVVGEEFGFVGVVILLGLYFIFLYRGIRVIVMARDTYGALLAAGIVSMFASI